MTDNEDKDVLIMAPEHDKEGDERRALLADKNEEEWGPFQLELIRRGYTSVYQMDGAFRMWQKGYPNKEILHYLRLLPQEGDFTFISTGVDPYKEGAYELTEAATSSK